MVLRALQGFTILCNRTVLTSNSKSAIQGYLHLNPVLVLSILFGVSKAMCDIPILVIALFGVVSYLYLKRKDRIRLVFFF
jgi:hypothetical protein